MKKKLLLFHFAYYILFLLLYVCFFYGSSWLFGKSGATDNLGAVIFYTLLLLYVATPVLIATLMRFSLLKWYVDPIAAAEIPLFFYSFMIFKQFRHTGNLLLAIQDIHADLSADGSGWLFLIGLFVFGLLASFSRTRKQGKSISYRLFFKKKS